MVVITSTICKNNCYLVQITNIMGVTVTVECFCSHFCLVAAHFVLSDINIGKVNLTFNSNLNDLNVIFTLYIHGNIDPEQSMVVITSTICKINCYLVKTTNMVIL